MDGTRFVLGLAVVKQIQIAACIDMDDDDLWDDNMDGEDYEKLAREREYNAMEQQHKNVCLADDVCSSLTITSSFRLVSARGGNMARKKLWRKALKQDGMRADPLESDLVGSWVS